MKKEIVRLSFAVTSKYFSVYQAFKTEAEKIGLVWAEDFNPFTEDMGKSRNCIWVQDNWNWAKASKGVGMSFSNTSDDKIDLDSNFEAGLEAVRELLANTVRNMTQEQIEKELGYKIQIIK